MADANPHPTPLPTGADVYLIKNTAQAIQVEVKHFQSLIGSLLYMQLALGQIFLLLYYIWHSMLQIPLHNIYTLLLMSCPIYWVIELRGSSGHFLCWPILQHLKLFPYIFPFFIFLFQLLQVQCPPLKLYAPTRVKNMSYFIYIICLSFYIQNITSTICLSPINYKTPIAYLCI